MRTIIFLLLLVGCVCSSIEADEKNETNRLTVITILHTCDFHGRHLPFVVVAENATSQTGNPQKPDNRFEGEGRIGGFEALAAAVDPVRQKRGEEKVLLFHAGDTFSDDLLGNLTKGEAVVRMMNAVGYDYMAIGNHDFDYGVAQTRRLQNFANFPMRGANIVAEETGHPFQGNPFHIFDVDKVKVAVLALGYHNTHQTTALKNIRGLRFTNGIEAARQYVPQLRRESDVIVVLSHQGTAVDKVLAKEVDGIDLIVGGHSHDRLHPGLTINNTRIVQAMSDTAALGEVRISLVKGKITSIEDELHLLWEQDFSDKNMATLVRELRQPYQEKLEEVIGTVKTPIARQYEYESPFDVLVADLLRKQAETDVALLPGVGYGVTLPTGKVRREALYTLLPHPVKLVTFQLGGRQIQSLLEQSAANLTADDPLNRVGGLIQTSGMTWTIDLSQGKGKRIRDVQVNGVPLDMNKSYRVASHNGMLNGIHRYDEFLKAKDVHISDEKVVDIVERYFQQAESISAPQPARVNRIPKPD